MTINLPAIRALRRLIDKAELSPCERVKQCNSGDYLKNLNQKQIKVHINPFKVKIEHTQSFGAFSCAAGRSKCAPEAQAWPVVIAFFEIEQSRPAQKRSLERLKE